MVVVLDYGLGNLRSVIGAVQRLGRDVRLAASAEELTGATRLVLPGVGAFRDGMANLRARGLIEPLARLVHQDRVPLLGICLGAQLLARSSDEFGSHEGLGWIPAAVRRLEPGGDLRVPHVGWNAIHRTGSASRLLHDIPDDSLFYFVHSYYIDVDRPDVATADCEYGRRFAAVVESGNVYGTQFHPEKSQRHGLAVLANFLALD
jgi:glutamine amidotransferase